MNRMLSLLLVSMSVVLAAGCSQVKMTPDDVRAYVPQMESVATVLTQQALMGQSETVKVAVATVAHDVNDALSGTFQVNADSISALVDRVFSKQSTLSPTVKSIVKSVLLVGLQSAQQQINKVGLDAAQSNALLSDFVKAAARGIILGSQTTKPTAVQFAPVGKSSVAPSCRGKSQCDQGKKCKGCTCKCPNCTCR